MSLPLVLWLGRSWLGAPSPCPSLPTDRPPPPLTAPLEASVVATSRVFTAGPYCSNFDPPTPPTPRLARMQPCSTARAALQRWSFPGSGELRLRGGQTEACVTFTSGSTPVSVSKCRDASGSPADLPPEQHWLWNTTTHEIQGGGHDACLNIRENLSPQKGEEEGDIHAIAPCPAACADNNTACATSWRYIESTGEIVSECAGEHCARWTHQCLTADPPPPPTPPAPPAPPPSGGEAGACGGYYDYGGPVLVLSANETLLAFFAGEKVTHHDANNWADAVLRRSFDRGRTWGPLQVVHSENNRSTPRSEWKATSAVAAALDTTTGIIWAIVGRNASALLVTSSSDHGASWAAGRDLHKPEGWGWLCPTFSGVQLRTGPKKGRLMMAIDFIEHYQYVAYPINGSRSGVIYSDDHGATWEYGGATQINMTNNEATVSELGDGTVILNSRNYLGKSHYGINYPYGSSAAQWDHPVHRGLSFSSTAGDSFSDTYHAPDLIEPVCEGSMITGWTTPAALGVVGNGTLFFTNPTASFERANLTLKMSTDRGCRWSTVLRLNNGTSMYSSMVQFSDGQIGVAFDDGSDITCPPNAAYGCGHNNETYKLIQLRRRSKNDDEGYRIIENNSYPPTTGPWPSVNLGAADPINECFRHCQSLPGCRFFWAYTAGAVAGRAGRCSPKMSAQLNASSMKPLHGNGSFAMMTGVPPPPPPPTPAPSVGRWQRFQGFGTGGLGAYGLSAFTIQGQPHVHYLAVAYFFGETSEIWRWDSRLDAGFSLWQTVPSKAGHAWRHFTVGTRDYLALANYRSWPSSGPCVDVAAAELEDELGGCPPITEQNSTIWEWSASSNSSQGSFVQIQQILTFGANAWEAFNISGVHYLAVANSHRNVTNAADQGDVRSAIYRWSGHEYVPVQSIMTHMALDVKHFVIAGSHYLAFANSPCFRPVAQHQSPIFRWNGSAFAPFQVVKTSGATGWEHFTIAGEDFLVVANRLCPTTGHKCTSEVFKWSESLFVHNQSIQTNGAYDWEHFEIANKHFLVVANNADTTSAVLMWTGAQFAPYQLLPTNGAEQWRHFTVGADHYLAVAQMASGNQTSQIFKWHPSPAAKSDDHQISLALSSTSTQIGNLAGLWRSQTMYQDWMEPPHDAGWLRLRQNWPSVPQWSWPSTFNKTDLFTSEMCTDGLLGGWNAGTPGNRPKTNPPDPSQDVAYKAADGSLAYRWPLLDLRLDDMVANGIRPLVMLGRVPWSLSANQSQQCTYGNAAPPANFSEWGEVVLRVCEHLLERYGERVKTWRFRVWTEPNQVDSFTGTVEDYAKMYDFAAASIRRALGPGPAIGVANMCRYCAVSRQDWQASNYTPNTHEQSYWTGVERLLEHFSTGVNWATGEVGSPVNFLAMSNYGCYGGSPTHKLGYQPSGTTASGILLSRFRERLGAGYEVSLELHEFGTLVNRHWRSSMEPGAFGAAWTFANWQAALASNISKAFHWGFEDGALGTDLLHSSAWAMAMGEGAVGGAKFANAFALGVQADSTLPLNTTATAFAVRGQASDLYIFVSTLNANKSKIPPLSLQLDLEKTFVPAPLADLELHEFRLDAATSLYDVALAELQRQNATATESLLKWDDGEVYPLSQMATPAGLKALQANQTAFEAMQAASLLPQAFSGKAAAASGGVRLSLTVDTPCALVVRLRQRNGVQ